MGREQLGFLRSFRQKARQKFEHRRQEKERERVIEGVRKRIVGLNNRLKAQDENGILELQDVDWEESKLTPEVRDFFESEFDERSEGITSLRVYAGIDECRTSFRSIQIQLNRRKTWFVNAYTSAWIHGEGGISVSLQCQSHGGQTQKGHEAMKTASTKFHGEEYSEFERFENRLEATTSILNFIETQLEAREEQI